MEFHRVYCLGFRRGCHAGSLGFERSFKPAFSAHHVTSCYSIVVCAADIVAAKSTWLQGQIKIFRAPARAHNASQLPLTVSCGALEYPVTVTVAELVANIKTHLTANPDIQQDPRLLGSFNKADSSGWNPCITQSSSCSLAVCSANIPSFAL